MVLRTPAGLKIESRVFQPGEIIHAPHLIDVEVAQVMRRLALGGADADACSAALEAWLTFPVQRYPHDLLIRRAWELRANFTAYDGVYLALAEWLRAPLITHDHKMAAGTHGVPVEVI